MAVVDEVVLSAKFLVDCLRDHDRSAGWRVLLLVVVLLNDLDIELTSQDLRSLARKLHQQIDSEGHVEREEHRDLRGSSGYLRALLVGVSGGGEHQRYIVHLTVAQQVGKCGRVREVDYNIGFLRKVEHLLVNREIAVLLAGYVNAGYDLAVRALTHKSGDNPAHSAACTGYCYFCHL